MSIDYIYEYDHDESAIAAMEARIVTAAIEMLQDYGDPRDNSMKMAKRYLESLLGVEAGA